ncbi:hypothetical protein N9792_05020 [Planktomarina temperata]|nr:hypothetical protein [Planktomarina temperata]MDB0019705.1 hypothetical protein [Planktomarina temperata]MDB0044069.1 hypothetical protein [Planktomarina temperata]MDB4200478.1 hypothetical protein [Planktomarina temperata]MDB9880991.1 hypothetical protein [Planktomarina temperata]
MRLPGGRQAQPGVATGQSHLAWRLGYAEVFNDENSLTRSLAEGGLQLLPGEKQKLPAGARSFQVCARRLCGGDSS